MSDSKRCKTCGNPVEVEQAKDGACPWCLAAFTFGPEPAGNPLTATKDPSKRFGKYVRTEKLGAGGMGEVWKALDTELNRYVALKFLKDEDPSATARFQREARTAASLSHGGIASIHEVGEVDGRQFIAMQYIQGRTMAHFPRKDRRLIVRLFRDAARALDHAHRHGVIHRDLKPDNLMVEEREDGLHVVILDFGLARAIEGGEKLSQSGEVYGTAAYMSPEQAKGEHLDERADVYSLGAAMYEVLTGRAPFAGANLLEVLRKVGSELPVKPRKLQPRIHRDLETIVLKCLEKDTDRRYSNARELAEDLDRFLNSDPIVARPASTLYRLKLTFQKRKAVALTAAAGLLGIVIVGGIYSGGSSREKAALNREKEARERAWGEAGTHVDLGRLKIDQLDQLLRVDEDRGREISLLKATAITELKEAIRLWPDHDEANFQLGRLHKLLYQSEAAMGFFTRVIEVAPRRAAAYLERASINLDWYEELRHHNSGRVRVETEEAAKILAQLDQDLAKVRSMSSELPHLKFAEGMLLFARGKYAEASTTLGEYVKLAPADSEGWLWLGHAQVHAKAPAAALESLTKAIGFRPRMSWAHGFRGIAYYDLDRYDESIAEHTRALELAPRNAIAYMNRGNALHLKGLHDEAIADLDQSIKLRPMSNAYNTRGLANGAKGLYGEAIRDFTRAIELEPSMAGAHYNRANARRRTREFDQALTDIKRALELDSTDSKAWTSLGDLLRETGKYDEAYRAYAKAIDIDPKYALAYHNRGVARRDQRQLKEAIDDFTKAIQLDSKQAVAFSNRGNARKALGLLDEALADHEKCVQLEPGDFKNWVNLGVVKSDQGRFVEAIADFSKALELNPKDEFAWLDRGNSKFFLGRLDEAWEDFTKLLSINPKSSPGHSGRCMVLRSMGRLDEALAAGRKAVELDPDDVEARGCYGVVLQDKGFVEDAIAQYDKAIQMDPKHPMAWMNRGNAKLSKDLWDEALRDWEMALDVASPHWPFRGQVAEEIQVHESRPAFREARRLHREKKFAEARALYLPIVAKHTRTKVGFTAAFNIACGYALSGEKAPALDWLEKAIDAGWKDASHTVRDTDLESIRGEEKFQQLIERMKAPPPAKPAN